MIRMLEISEDQAKAIALKAMAYPADETDRVFAVEEGATEDERFRRLACPQPYRPSPNCWIVLIRPLEERGYGPDGPEAGIWVDQRTGNIMKIGLA